MRKKDLNTPKDGSKKELTISKRKTKKKKSVSATSNKSSLSKPKKRIAEDKTDNRQSKSKSKTIRAKKNFIVVAYDISDDKRRNRIAKILLKYGTRINFSVFECMITDMQLENLKKEIAGKIKPKTDTVVFYPICMKCYTKIVYLPPKKVKYEVITII